MIIGMILQLYIKVLKMDQDLYTLLHLGLFTVYDVCLAMPRAYWHGGFCGS